MPRRPVALRHAITFLRDTVAQARQAGTKRLPRTRELARAAGVSVTTMGKAVAELANQGELTARHGKGIHWVDKAASTQSPPPRRPPQFPLPHDTRAPHSPRWREVADRLIADIVQGNIPGAPRLPSRKELTVRYGTCYRVLAQAVEHLVAQGRLEPSQRGFRYVHPLRQRSRSTILTFIRGQVEGGRAIMLEHQAEWHRLLQRECSQAGLALVSVICGFKHLQKSLFRQDRPGAPIVDPGELARAMGAVVFTSGIENIGIPSFTRELTRAGLRVALYDNSGGSCADEISDLPGVLRLGPGWRTSAVAGQVVGEYLLGAGHRHVAYVSPVADLGWSQDRLAGLEHAMTGPGIDGAVDVVQCARSDLERGRTTYSSLERREALEQTVAWCLQHDDPRFTQLADAIFSYRFDFSNHAGMHETAERLLPLFERAYALPHATAWVCSNDTVALAALRFLSERGVDVPGRISMVGFDDSRSAYLHGLTSYNFGDALLLRIALSHARGFPDASKAAQSVRGFVSVRRSTMRG